MKLAFTTATLVAFTLFLACSSSESEDAGSGKTGACRVNAQCTPAEVCKDGQCVASDAGTLTPGPGGGGGGGGGGSDAGTGISCVDAPCDGCCTSNDECIDVDSDFLCGRFGNPCVDCNAQGKSCQDGYCQSVGDCNSANCTGCCTAMGTCVGGGSNSSCGIGGSFCEDCTLTSRLCTNGYCN